MLQPTRDAASGFDNAAKLTAQLPDHFLGSRVCRRNLRSCFPNTLRDSASEPTGENYPASKPGLISRMTDSISVEIRLQKDILMLNIPAIRSHWHLGKFFDEY